MPKKFLNLLFLLTFIFILLYIVNSKINKNFVHAVDSRGNYMVFSGGYIQTQITPLPLSAFSFEAYIYPNSLSGKMAIFSIGSNTAKNPLYELSTNATSLSFEQNYSSNSRKVIVSGNLTANVWNHVALSMDGTKTHLFINGNRIINSTSNNFFEPLGANIYLGKSVYQFSGNKNFSGLMDEVRISNVYRDVSALWNANIYTGNLISDANTLLLYSFEGSRGQTAVGDLSANGYNGILIGGDSQIHYYGVLPTPTQYVIPTIRFRIITLPTLSWPRGNTTPAPTTGAPSPTFGVPAPTGIFQLPTLKLNRDFFHR